METGIEGGSGRIGMKSYEKLQSDLRDLRDEIELALQKERQAYNKRLNVLIFAYDKKTEEGMRQFRQHKEELEREHEAIVNEIFMIFSGRMDELLTEYFYRDPEPGEVPEGMWFSPYMEQLRAVWHERTADREGLWLRLKAASDEYYEHRDEPEVYERYYNERYIENPRDREELRVRTAEQVTEIQKAFRERVTEFYSYREDQYDPELAEHLDNGFVPDEDLDNLIIQNSGNVTMLHVIFDYCHRSRVEETDVMRRYEADLNAGGKTEFNVLQPIAEIIMNQVEADREVYWRGTNAGFEYQVRKAGWKLCNISVKPEG